MYGFESGDIRKYSYKVHGTKAPKMGSEVEKIVHQQLLLARRLQNKLVEIELNRRAEIRAAVRRNSPECEKLEEEDRVLKEAIKNAREAVQMDKMVHRNKRPGKELSAEVKRLLALREEMQPALSEARKAAYKTPNAKKELAQIDLTHTVLTNNTLNDFKGQGLFWPTAGRVLARIPKKWDVIPKFKAYDGSGSISVQFQRKGDTKTAAVPLFFANGEPKMRNGKHLHRRSGEIPVTFADLVKGTKMMKIVYHIRKDGTPSPKWADVYFRVGTGKVNGKSRQPVMVKIRSVRIDRTPPKEAVIKWAHLIRRRVGYNYVWKLSLDFEMANGWPEPDRNWTRAETGVVAVALGWRMVDDQLRVGYWVGDDGREGEIFVPPAAVFSWNRCDELVQRRDKLFNEAHAEMVAWLQTGPPAPEEFLVRLETLPQWKSKYRLNRFVQWWQNNRFTGDNAMFQRMRGWLQKNPGKGKMPVYTGWAAQERHITNWMTAMKDKAGRQRTGHYLAEAIRLATEYRHVVVADINWRTLGYDPQPEEDVEKVNKKNKALAASATCRDALQKFMDPIKVDPPYVMLACHRCGEICDDPGRGRWLVCNSPTCGGVKVDRAKNVAKNVLDRGLATLT